jgi:DNA excision repair protein ERCC-6
VLVKVLAAWHKEDHKVLLFTQTQQMLDILEKHVVAEGYSYHRMDGNTPIAQRGRLMDDFNNNPDRCVCVHASVIGGHLPALLCYQAFAFVRYAVPRHFVTWC